MQITSISVNIVGNLDPQIRAYDEKKVMLVISSAENVGSDIYFHFESMEDLKDFIFRLNSRSRDL